MGAKQTAVVTGGSAGIGRALAQALVQRGVTVLIIGRNAATLERARAELGGDTEAAAGDVRDAGFMSATIRELAARHGRLDYLFNNAGVGLAGLARDLPDSEWRTQLDVNLYGVVHGISAALPIMCAQRSGHIVNIASLAGLVPLPAMAPYVAAKHAVVGLSLALAVEAEASGVRVSAVCPAGVETSMTDHAACVGLDREHMRRRIPLPLLKSEACARLILAGVDRGERLILPGPARWIALLHRYLPFLTRRMARSFAGVVDEARARAGGAR